MEMNLDWKDCETQFISNVDHVLAWFQGELNKIRAGQATVGLVDGAKIEAYGTLNPIHQVANISIPEPQVLIIKPFDPTIINEIIKGVVRFNDQLNPLVDGKLIRIKIPAPSEESRKHSIKLIKSFLEKTKITIRNTRKQVQSKIKAAKLQEGLEQIYLEKLDQLTKKYNDEADRMFAKKEKNLLTI